MQASHPQSFRRRILVTVAGLTPQIITETLYALVTREPAFVPTEVHVLTTQIGSRLFSKGLEAYRRFFEEDYAPIFAAHGLRFGDVTVQSDKPRCFAPRLGSVATYIHVLTDSEGLSTDVRTPEDNERVGAFIMDAVLELTSYPDAAVHASIAGGRKTMGFYLGYLMSMFGRDQDRLSHVLVDQHCEITPTFFYPPPTKTRFTTRNGHEFVPGPGSVMLSEIPFIRHRSGFADADLRQPGMTFSGAVAIAQRAIPRLELRINVRAKQVTAGGQLVPMTDNPLSWLLWFAERRAGGSNGCTWQSSSEEFLACYARVLDENASLKWDATHDALKNVGYTPTDFRNRVSAVNRAFEKALGKLPAAPYLIQAIGKKRQGEDRPYELQLPAAAIFVDG